MIHEANAAARPMVRVAIGVALAGISGLDGKNLAIEHANKAWGAGSQPARLVREAINAGGITPAASWGAELSTANAVQTEFLSVVVNKTVFGRALGLTVLPFGTRAIVQTSGAKGEFIDESAPKIPSALRYNEPLILTPAKCASLVVVTKELVRSASPAAVVSITNNIVQACALAVDDRAFGNYAATTGGAPASVTNGAPVIESSGDVAADVSAAAAAYGGNWSTAVWVMNPATAVQLALSRDAAGTALFPTITARGGTLGGVPVFTSDGCPAASLILLDVGCVVFSAADPSISMSEQAVVQMAGNPDASTQAVPLWQSNLCGFLAELAANWQVVQPPGGEPCVVIHLMEAAA